MKPILQSAFLCAMVSVSAAQNQTQIKLDSDNEERIFATRLSQLLPHEELLSSADFEWGYVVYQSGKRSEAFPWNYDRLFHRMVYVAGDTFFLKNDNQIQSIVTDKSQYFYYPKWGFVKTYPGEAPVKLGSQYALEIRSRTKLQAHENPRLITTSTSFSVIYHPQSYMLAREHVVIRRKALFFLLDETGTARLANANSFKRAFPQMKAQIDRIIRQRYAARKRLDFANENDVRELFDFCIGNGAR